MTSKEILLWMVLLIASLSAGYFHGYHTKTQSLNIPCRARVLVIPESLAQTMQQTFAKQTFEKCNLEFFSTKNGKELETQLITHSDVDLIFASQFVAQLLLRNSLLAETASWSAEIENHLDKNFLFKEAKFFHPSFWYQSKIIALQKIDITTNRDKYITKLLDEPSLLYRKETLWMNQKNKPIYLASKKFGPSQLLNEVEIAPLEIYEASHLTQVKNPLPNIYSDINYPGNGIVILGLMIPKNTSSIEKSIKLAQVLLSNDNYKKLLFSLPLATTFKNLNAELSIKEKHSTYISELKLVNTEGNLEQSNHFEILDSKILSKQ